MSKKENLFEGATVQDAIANGLKALGITEDRAEIKVKNRGSFFTKPTVEITIKEEVAAPATVEEEAAPTEEVAIEEPTEEAAPVKGAPTEEDCAAAEERVRSFVEGLLEEMKLDCTAEVSRTGEDINVNITGKSAGAVIGYRGEVLDAVQYMALWIANNSVKDFIRVSLDAENYRKKRNDTLTALAVRLAHKAARTGRKVALEAMNPFERRVIHTALQDDKYVHTASEGEGSFRHVVIIPNEEKPRYNNEHRSGEGNAHRSGVYSRQPEMTYGTSAAFRRKGAVKTKSYGAPSKKPF